MNNFSFYKGGKALYCLIFMGLLLSFSSIYAKNFVRHTTSLFQQLQIKGIVTDGTNPLPGVTIAIKGKPNSGALTDYTGAFTINAVATDVLVVSFMGFKTVSIPIEGKQQLTISLAYDTTTLQEVRVNAGYYTVKESERTGSIARITAKDIETQPVTNVLATMQGRMAGVNITQTTGVPGGGFDIQIRGQNSLRAEGNAPLYIVDGVPYSSDPIGYNQTSTIFATKNSSPLNSINPETIESIEVLKDADATAIYGSRGANGVVLLTTKKGKEGKTTFTFNASTGFGTVTQFVKLMDSKQYLAMRRQAFSNDGFTAYPQWEYDINGTWDQNRSTDWQKKLIGGTAAITELQGTISGGSQYTQFRASGNYRSESTVFPGDFMYKKGGAQLNLNHQSADSKFRATFSAGSTIQKNYQPSNDFTSDSRTLPPNAPALYDSEGNLNWENGTWNNPLRNLDANYDSTTKDLIANALLSYEILPDLLLKSSFGFTDLQHLESRIDPSTIYNPSFGFTSAISSLYLNTTRRSSTIIEPQLEWEKKTGAGKFGVLAGGSFQRQATHRLFQFGTGFSTNSLLHDLASANTQRVLLSDEALYNYQAFFGRINYNWKDRYIFNLTGRRDGSSRFGPDNRFATFGAMGVAWLFFNESFVKKSSWLSFGKLRSSYGTTGSDQIGDYQFMDTYNSSGVSYDTTIGLQPTRLFNPNFGWEINKKMEAAVELGLFADRIFLTGAWYQNRSSNQLVGIPLPGTTGFNQIQANLKATVENTGFEYTLRSVNFSGKDFNWTTSFNLSISRNKLIAFPDLENSTYKNKYRIGEPLNIMLRYKYTGLDPVTGVYQFADENNDGVLTAPDDRQTVINLTPDYFGGFQNQLRYKNWKLDFLFHFVKQKNQIYDSGVAGMMINQPEDMQHNWQRQGDTTPYQIYSAGYNFGALAAQSQYSNSDATITDASYVRLKTVAVSFDVPLQSKKIQCTVLLQGQNLLLFTPYSYGDPEFTARGYLPPLKIISSGIQLTF